MATPTSKTAIVNLALRHLAEDPVISIDPPDEDSKAAEAGAAWYDQARRDTLEAHPWGFAKKRAHLVSDATDPLFEWNARYELPSDYIRLAYVGEDWRNPVSEEDYDIEGEYIVCNETSPLPITYIWDISDATKFSPKFVTALTYKLAALMAYNLTGNAQVVTAMENQFTLAVSGAMSVSGQNRKVRRVQKSRLAAARTTMGRFKDVRRWGDE